jgi:hypothetical protein
MTQPKPVTFTPEDVRRIRMVYEDAVKHRKDVFTVVLEDGQEIELVVGYARYLLEFLESAFKPRGNGGTP